MLLFIFIFVSGDKYLGGSNSEYTLEKPGGDINDCLSDGSCLVVNNFEIAQTSDINVNTVDKYTLGSTNEGDPKFVLELSNSFNFIISKNYEIKYLEVFFFFFFIIDFLDELP
jgi:hypothetical protein